MSSVTSEIPTIKHSETFPNLGYFPFGEDSLSLKGFVEGGNSKIWVNKWLNQQRRQLDREADFLFGITKPFILLKFIQSYYCDVQYIEKHISHICIAF